MNRIRDGKGNIIMDILGIRIIIMNFYKQLYANKSEYLKEMDRLLDTCKIQGTMRREEGGRKRREGGKPYTYKTVKSKIRNNTEWALGLMVQMLFESPWTHIGVWVSSTGDYSSLIIMQTPGCSIYCSNKYVLETMWMI